MEGELWWGGGVGGGEGSFLWFKTMLSVPVGGGEGERVGNVCACFVRGYVSATGGFFFFTLREERRGGVDDYTI